MKKFENPEVNVIRYTVEDILTVSSEPSTDTEPEQPPCEAELPLD